MVKFAFQWKFLVTRIVKCHESCIPMKVFGCKNCKMWWLVCIPMKVFGYKNYKMSQIKDAHHKMFQIAPF